MLAHVGAFYVEGVVKSWMLQKHCKNKLFLWFFMFLRLHVGTKIHHFGALLGHVGAKMDYVGAKLGYVVILAHLGAILEPSWSQHEPIRAPRWIRQPPIQQNLVWHNEREARYKVKELLKCLKTVSCISCFYVHLIKYVSMLMYVSKTL